MKIPLVLWCTTNRYPSDRHWPESIMYKDPFFCWHRQRAEFTLFSPPWTSRALDQPLYAFLWVPYFISDICQSTEISYLAPSTSSTERMGKSNADRTPLLEPFGLLSRFLIYLPIRVDDPLIILTGKDWHLPSKIRHDFEKK